MTDTLTTDDVITTAIISLLENGVPTGPISKAFDITQTVVKSIQATLRIKQYGAAEIAELLQNAMFEAYAQAMQQMSHGSPAARQRMIGLVLSKAMALVGRQSPEEFHRLRAGLTDLLKDMTSVKATATTPSLYATPDFSPTATADTTETSTTETSTSDA